MLDKLIDQKMNLLISGFVAAVSYVVPKRLSEFYKKFGPLGVSAIVIIFVLRNFFQKCSYKTFQAFKVTTSKWIFPCHNLNSTMGKWRHFHCSMNGNGRQV
jgi:hypothetical protein